MAATREYKVQRKLSHEVEVYFDIMAGIAIPKLVLDPFRFFTGFTSCLGKPTPDRKSLRTRVREVLKTVGEAVG